METKIMTPADLRNQNFAGLRQTLRDDRLAVWAAWLSAGSGATTREMAQRSGIDLLTFRPRTTELQVMGLVRLVDRQCRGGICEGIYRARSEPEWIAWQAGQNRGVSTQQQLL